MASIAYVGNTNVLTLTGLKGHDEDTYLNDATVTVTVKNSASSVGTGVTGETWPVTMDYVAASDGEYRAIINADAELVAGQTYTALVDVDASDSDDERVGHWEFSITARTRTK